MSDEFGVYRKRDLPAATGLSMSSIDRLERKGLFPQRFALGTDANSPVGWLMEAVRQWVYDRQPKPSGLSPFARS